MENELIIGWKWSINLREVELVREKKEGKRGRKKKRVAGAWAGQGHFGLVVAECPTRPGPSRKAPLSASPGPNACPGGPTAPSLTRQPPFGLAVADWALFGQAGAN